MHVPSLGTLEEFKSAFFSTNSDMFDDDPMDVAYVEEIYHLIKLRRDLGISQEELGARLDTAASAIGRFERGAYTPSFKWLKRYARALGYDLKLHIIDPHEDEKG